VSTLARIGAEARQQALESPAIVVVGDIVKMRERLLAAAPDRKP
jgi:siroheme synthase